MICKVCGQDERLHKGFGTLCPVIDNTGIIRGYKIKKPPADLRREVSGNALLDAVRELTRAWKDQELRDKYSIATFLTEIDLRMDKVIELIKPGAVVPREKILWFAGQMEEKLKENNDKDGWKQSTITWLLKKLLEEFAELQIETDSSYAKDNYNNIIRKAADVANFAMMIADKAWNGCT